MRYELKDPKVVALVKDHPELARLIDEFESIPIGLNKEASILFEQKKAIIAKIDALKAEATVKGLQKWDEVDAYMTKANLPNNKSPLMFNKDRTAIVEFEHCDCPKCTGDLDLPDDMPEEMKGRIRELKAQAEKDGTKVIIEGFYGTTDGAVAKDFSTKKDLH